MLDKDKKKIIALMKKDPEIKLSSVAEYTGLSLSSVKKDSCRNEIGETVEEQRKNRKSIWSFD